MNDEKEHEGGNTQYWFNLVLFLLAMGLSLVGWGFNNWAHSVESGTSQVLQKLEKIESRAEDHDRRIRVLERQDAIFDQKHESLERELNRLEKQLP